MIVKPKAIQHGRAKPATPPQWERIRPDHWVPFAILEGFESSTRPSEILEALTAVKPKVLGNYFDTKNNSRFTKWEPSNQMKVKLI